MSSAFKIHRPSVLATLARPLDHTNGQIVASTVYGRRDGEKTRKRTELAVGVDGEAASIYDVPASRMITSYPIPPQESFTCAPYSIRVRHTGSNDVSRYTFIATKDKSSQKISLFKDVIQRDGKTTSTTVTQTLKTSPITHITNAAVISQVSPIGDIIVVCRDGEVLCLSGEKLTTLWKSSCNSLLQDVVSTPFDNLAVDFVSSGSVQELQDSIFKSQADVLSALPKGMGPDASLMVIVVRDSGKTPSSRYLMTLAALPASGLTASTSTQQLVNVDISPLPSAPENQSVVPQYQLDTSVGLLLELVPGTLNVYDISGSVPKIKSSAQIDSCDAFTKLSKPFVLSCSSDSFSLFNYQYRSVHASAELDLSDLPSDVNKKGPYQLINYFRKQDLVVGLIDNVLVSIPIEPPSNHGKRRQGLLIDSIGRGAAIQLPSKRPRSSSDADTFSHTLPGTISEEYLANFQVDTEHADQLLANNDVAGWDDYLRNKFNIALFDPSKDPQSDTKDAKTSQDWHWPKTFPTVDRRWVCYAISQIFAIDAPKNGLSRATLRLVFPESTALTYLAMAGHLTRSNLKSAFRDDLVSYTLETKDLAGDLLACLVKADVSLALLMSYLTATRLGEVELLLTIRALMKSMDLIADPEKIDALRLLKNEPEPTEADPENVEMDLDVLERDLAITEHYLGDENSTRSRGITLALSKLWRSPATKTVIALRDTLKTEEILSLIHLLRVELVRGAWTSLYIDPTYLDSGSEAPPDGVITLLADLLGRCLDSIGAGGWLFNDSLSTSWADGEEANSLLSALRLEVSAALEGVQQAVALNSLVGDAARYGAAARQWSGSSSGKAISVGGGAGGEMTPLPLGLRTKGVVGSTKVVSGGEVVQRSARERGHLLSKRVEAYSLEKLRI